LVALLLVVLLLLPPWVGLLSVQSCHRIKLAVALAVEAQRHGHPMATAIASASTEMVGASVGAEQLRKPLGPRRS
jgi:hypothetical protein